MLIYSKISRFTHTKMSLLSDATAAISSDQFHRLWVGFFRHIFINGSMAEYMEPLWNCVGKIANSTSPVASINKFVNTTLYKAIQDVFHTSLGQIKIFITKKNIIAQFQNEFCKGKSNKQTEVAAWFLETLSNFSLGFRNTWFNMDSTENPHGFLIVGHGFVISEQRFPILHSFRLI